MSAEDSRVAQSKSKVIQAAINQLCNLGVEEISVEGIAKNSGVAKTTIYRHWDSLDQILLDSFNSMYEDLDSIDSGSVTKDVTKFIVELIKCQTTQNISKAMPNLMELANADKKFAKLKKKFMNSRIEPLILALRRGIDRGELKNNIDINLMTNQIVGPIYSSFMFSEKPIATSQAKILAHNVLSNYLI